MDLIFDTSGLDDLRRRVADARAMLPDQLQQAVKDAGDFVAQNLRDAAPVGQGEEGSPPPAGDQPGRLADSFYAQEETSKFTDGAAITVRTRQPLKLQYVVKGRGEVVPVAKRALYWKGLAYPVRRSGPSTPNDFVSEALTEVPDAAEALGVVIEQLQQILE